MRILGIVWVAQLKRKWPIILILFILGALLNTSLQTPKIAEHFVYSKWKESAEKVDMIVGYKGSPLQIVASSLYRLENPTGNLEGTSVDFWQNHPLVDRFCRISLGDYFKEASIVGVDTSYYTWFDFELVEGRIPENEHDLYISLDFAQKHGLSIGDAVHSSHGASGGENHDHHHLSVCGIFKAKRTADNQAVFVLPEAYQELHGVENKDVTSILVKLKTKSAMLMLPGVFKSRENEQGAFPVFIFAQLQKQWEPTLHRILSYSNILGIVLSIVFIAYLVVLAKEERMTINMLRLKKISAVTQGTSVFGLYFISAFTGMAFVFLLLPYVFDTTISIYAIALSALPLIVSFTIVYLKEIKA